MESNIMLPEIGTKYWYVRVHPLTCTFMVSDNTWNDYVGDRLRLVQVNVYLTMNDAMLVAEQQNLMMKEMPPSKPKETGDEGV